MVVEDTVHGIKAATAARLRAEGCAGADSPAIRMASRSRSMAAKAADCSAAGGVMHTGTVRLWLVERSHARQIVRTPKSGRKKQL